MICELCSSCQQKCKPLQKQHLEMLNKIDAGNAGNETKSADDSKCICAQCEKLLIGKYHTILQQEAEQVKLQIQLENEKLNEILRKLQNNLNDTPSSSCSISENCHEAKIKFEKSDSIDSEFIDINIKSSECSNVEENLSEQQQLDTADCSSFSYSDNIYESKIIKSEEIDIEPSKRRNDQEELSEQQQFNATVMENNVMQNVSNTEHALSSATLPINCNALRQDTAIGHDVFAVLTNITDKLKDKSISIRQKNTMLFSLIKMLDDGFYCCICGESSNKFTSRQGIISHIKVQHIGYRLTCTECKRFFVEPQTLRQHYKKIHNLNRGGKFEFEIVKQQAHKTVENEGSKVDATVKNRTISKPVNYNDLYSLIKKLDYSFYCGICGESSNKYTGKAGVLAHIKINHMGYRFTCTECKRNFNERKNLREHYKSIHNISNGLIAFEKAVEQNDNPVDACKKFTVKDAFKKNGDFYECNLCNDASKQYATRCGVRTHTKIVHFGYRYKCDICSMTSSSATTLKEHVKDAHNSVQKCIKLVPDSNSQSNVLSATNDSLEQSCSSDDIVTSDCNEFTEEMANTSVGRLSAAGLVNDSLTLVETECCRDQEQLKDQQQYDTSSNSSCSFSGNSDEAKIKLEKSEEIDIEEFSWTDYTTTEELNVQQQCNVSALENNVIQTALNLPTLPIDFNAFRHNSDVGNNGLSLLANITGKVKKKTIKWSSLLKKLDNDYYCCICGESSYKYKSRLSIITHIKVQHIGYRFPCTECKCNFKSRNNIRQHYKCVHKIRNGRIVFKMLAPHNFHPVAKQSRKIKSKTISKANKNLSGLIKKRHDAFYCVICGDRSNKYMCRESIVAHIKINHMGYRFTCTKCNHYFKARKYLTKHYRIIHRITNGVINFEQAIQRNDKPVDACKIYSVKNGNFFECTMCNVSEKYISRKGIAHHIKTVHYVYRYVCYICSVQYLRAEKLKLHILNFHNCVPKCIKLVSASNQSNITNDSHKLLEQTCSNKRIRAAVSSHSDEVTQKTINTGVTRLSIAGLMNECLTLATTACNVISNDSVKSSSNNSSKLMEKNASESVISKDSNELFNESIILSATANKIPNTGSEELTNSTAEITKDGPMLKSIKTISRDSNEIVREVVNKAANELCKQSIVTTLTNFELAAKSCNTLNKLSFLKSPEHFHDQEQLNELQQCDTPTKIKIEKSEPMDIEEFLWQEKTTMKTFKSTERCQDQEELSKPQQHFDTSNNSSCSFLGNCHEIQIKTEKSEPMDVEEFSWEDNTAMETFKSTDRYYDQGQLNKQQPFNASTLESNITQNASNTALNSPTLPINCNALRQESGSVANDGVSRMINIGISKPKENIKLSNLIIKKHDNTFYCGICAERSNKYTGRPGVVLHIKINHMGYRYTCTECERNFNTGRHLGKHYKSKHNIINGLIVFKRAIEHNYKPIDVCKQFSVKDTYKKIGNFFECTLCSVSAKYISRCGIQYHVKTVHYGYGFICPICSKKLMSTVALKTHMKDSHNSVPKCIKLVPASSQKQTSSDENIESTASSDCDDVTQETVNTSVTSLPIAKDSNEIVEKVASIAANESSNEFSNQSIVTKLNGFQASRKSSAHH